MTKQNEIKELILSAFKKEAIKKLVFSRPREGEITAVKARTVKTRLGIALQLEYFLPGNTVSHKNACERELEALLPELIDNYSQINLITTLGEAEYKLSKRGKATVLGGEKLMARLSGESAIEALSAVMTMDNKKNYILEGGEDFLIELGISDKTGRVHDKRQGKFRQINRFLEIIEDIYGKLPSDGELTVYDLCCGKSYLSFAVYYYLTVKKGRSVTLLGIDLKRDCIRWCAELAERLSYTGMKFVCDDIKNTPKGVSPDMVISLHACDVATDIVIDRAAELSAGVILSTPCCHRYMNDKLSAGELSFVTKHPYLKGKLAAVLTDAVRCARLEAKGYSVSAIELTDPDDTPKNTLIRAIRTSSPSDGALSEYERILAFLLGDKKDTYLKEFL